MKMIDKWGARTKRMLFGRRKEQAQWVVEVTHTMGCKEKGDVILYR